MTLRRAAGMQGMKSHERGGGPGAFTHQVQKKYQDSYCAALFPLTTKGIRRMLLDFTLLYSPKNFSPKMGG